CTFRYRLIRERGRCVEHWPPERPFRGGACGTGPPQFPTTRLLQPARLSTNGRPDGRPLSGWPARFSAEPHDVLRRVALLPLDDVERHTLSLSKRLEPLHLDRGVVDEAVLRAVLGRDEAEALGIVEPLHCADGTHP